MANENKNMAAHGNTSNLEDVSFPDISSLAQEGAVGVTRAAHLLPPRLLPLVVVGLLFAVTSLARPRTIGHARISRTVLLHCDNWCILHDRFSLDFHPSFSFPLGEQYE